MLQRVAEIKPTDITVDVEVVERRDMPGAWTVEATETDGDGAVYQAIFIGPEAKQRAEEYATIKYRT